MLFFSFLGGGGGGGVYVLQDAGSSDPDVVSCSHFILKVFPVRRLCGGLSNACYVQGVLILLGIIFLSSFSIQNTHIIQVYVSM